MPARPEPRLPHLFEHRLTGKVYSHFQRLNHEQRQKFIKDFLWENRNAEKVADLILQNHPEFRDEIKAVGLDFLNEERKITLFKNKITKKEQHILDREVLIWFNRCSLEQKLRILKNKLYGADPIKFIDEIIDTFNKTNNPEYIKLLFKTGANYYRNNELINEMIKKGHIDILVKCGYFSTLVKTYYKELADSGYLRDIIRDGGAIKALVRSDIKYFHQITKLGQEGIYVLIKAGFIQELNTFYYDQLIDAIGFERYALLMHRLK